MPYEHNMQFHAKGKGRKETQRQPNSSLRLCVFFAPLRETYLSAEHDREGEAGFARLFVLAVHLLGGLGQCLHGCVEVNAMS